MVYDFHWHEMSILSKRLVSESRLVVALKRGGSEGVDNEEWLQNRDGAVFWEKMFHKYKWCMHSMMNVLNAMMSFKWLLFRDFHLLQKQKKGKWSCTWVRVSIWKVGQRRGGHTMCGVRRVSLGIQIAPVTDLVWAAEASAAVCRDLEFLFHLSIQPTRRLKLLLFPTVVGLLFRLRPQSTGRVGWRHCHGVCCFQRLGWRVIIKGLHVPCLYGPYRPEQQPQRWPVYWTEKQSYHYCMDRAVKK